MAKQGQTLGQAKKTQPRAKLSEARAFARGIAWGILRGKPNLSALEAFSTAWTTKPIEYYGVYTHTLKGDT